MVQNLSTQPQNNFGTISRVGATNNGRIVYQVTDGAGKASVKMSVAQKDCDKFEKSYKDIMESAPKLQKYAQSVPPEKMQKKQKIAKWIVGGCALLGGLWPALKVKGAGFPGFIKQAGLTLLGAGAGAVAGMFVASKMVTPPGAMQFAKASQTLSKLDIQPVQE